MTVLRGYLSHPGRTLTVLGLVVALALLASAGSALAGPASGNGNGNGTSAKAGPSNAAGHSAATKRSTARQGQPANPGRGQGRSGPARGNGKAPGSSEPSFQAASTGGGETQGASGRSSPRGKGNGSSGRSGPPAHAAGGAGGGTGGGSDRPHPHADDDEVLSGVRDDGGSADDAVAGADERTPANGEDAPFAVGTAAGSVDAAPPAGGGTASAAGGETTSEPIRLAGVVTPEETGEAAAAGLRPGLLDRFSHRTSRALDTVLSPTRDFGVPALLVAILLVYLALQRRLDRGALPMSAMASSSDGNQTHVRYEL